MPKSNVKAKLRVVQPTVMLSTRFRRKLMLSVFQRCLSLSNGCPKATIMNSMVLSWHFPSLDKKLVPRLSPFFFIDLLLMKSASKNNLVLMQDLPPSLSLACS